jgi:DNA-binding CsgD family transcriptional regulator
VPQHDLLGRSEQRRKLADALDPARRTPKVIALVAPRGRGMTTLLAEAAVLATERGLRVLTATGHADERDLPGAGLHQLWPGLDRTGAASWLATAGPVVVIVDDLHLLDDLTAEVLSDLMTGVDGPVTFLVGARAASLLPPGTVVVPLPPLTDTDAAALLARQPAVPRGRARLEILRRARGNPRAIADLAAAFPGENEILQMPPAKTINIRQRYAPRLAALPEPVLRLARQVSARLGDEDQVTVLTAAGAGTTELATALASGLLEQHGPDLCFADPLAAIAAYTSCPASDRAESHRRFATALPPGSLPHARHLAAAASEPSEPLAGMLEHGADQARRASRHHEQAAALHRAAELSPVPADAARRYAEALAAASLTGQTTWVRELYTALLAQGQPDDLRPDAVCAAALATSRTGSQREAMDLLVDGVRRLPGGIAGSLLIVSTAAQITQVSALPEHRDVLAGLMGRLDPPAGGQLLRRAIEVTLDPYRPWPLAPAPDPEPGEDPVGRALTLAYLADAAGDARAAIQLREDALAAMRAHGSIVAFPEMWLPLLMGLGDQGRYAEALALAAEVRGVCATADLPLLELEVDAIGSLISALRDDITRATALAEPSWARAYLHENRRLHYYLSMTVGVTAFTEGDYAAAYQHYRRLFDPDGRTLYPDSGGHALLGLTVIAPRAGQSADAAQVLSAYEVPATLRIQLLVDHVRAELLGGDRAEEHFRRSIDDPAGETWALDRALARMHYGGWLRRQRRPSDAREQLTAALDALERFGATALATIARGELEASGGLADLPSDLGVLGQLSPQQRTIVELAVRGLRDTEIAAQLQISPRTVGTHLSSAYQKLGVRSRRELSKLPDSR